MRQLRFQTGPGRPTKVAQGNLNELLMLTEAAVSVTNVQRWAQEQVLKKASTGFDINDELRSLKSRSKKLQYETSVVDEFLQLGAQSFAIHESLAVWERPLPSGERGRPPAVDVSLFNSKAKEESRIEFGFYSRSKLKSDARKLADLFTKGVLPSHQEISNYIILWELAGGGGKFTKVKDWLEECEAAAGRNSTRDCKIKLKACSTQDLFSPSEKSGGENILSAAIFKIE